MTSKYLYTGVEWTPKSLQKAWGAIQKINDKYLKLDVYSTQLEIIDYDRMLEIHAGNGLPVMYNHWSFGKHYIREKESYKKHKSGLAYEVVLNTDPCIAYLLDTNSMTTQTLVMAHAGIGHNAFFKNNYEFTDWTLAKGIVDYLIFAKNYIKKCEEKYGEKEVEFLLTALHALRHHAVDRYKRDSYVSPSKQDQKVQSWLDYFDQKNKHLTGKLEAEKRQKTNEEIEAIIKGIRDDRRTFPEENILYFIEKHSFSLAPWEREIVRIVRKIEQYYYPQRLTKLINEGFATYIHYFIMNKLYETGQIDDGSYLEFLNLHTNVIYQPMRFDLSSLTPINVYALGFGMFKDIERICTNPTKEDEYYFPAICNTDPLTTIIDIMKNYRDESFILQFLSPKLVRDFKLLLLEDNSTVNYILLKDTHDEEGFRNIREHLAQQYNYLYNIPQMEIVGLNEDDQGLIIHHKVIDDRFLDNHSAKAVWSYLQYLHGKEPEIYFVDTNNNIII